MSDDLVDHAYATSASGDYETMNIENEPFYEDLSQTT